jgi:flagellar biosynthesis GTPase FlhF
MHIPHFLLLVLFFLLEFCRHDFKAQMLGLARWSEADGRLIMMVGETGLGETTQYAKPSFYVVAG